MSIAEAADHIKDQQL